MQSSYRTIIIEDEKPARDRLKHLLEDIDEIELIDEAGDGETGSQKINMLKPDLIFLDIEMPVYNGFEMLKYLEHFPLIIFTTAYDQFALQAFEENSIDYLLKPIEKNRLQKAVEKLKGIRQFQGTSKALGDQLQRLMLDIQKPKVLSAISIQLGDTIRLVRTSDVTHLSAEDKYVTIFDVQGKKHLTHHSLTSLKEQLGDSFIQIHRACIINTDHIQKIHKGFKGRFTFVLGTGNQNSIQVSSGVTYAKTLRKYFNL